jgi:hypothetical protein
MGRLLGAHTVCDETNSSGQALGTGDQGTENAYIVLLVVFDSKLTKNDSLSPVSYKVFAQNTTRSSLLSIVLTITTSNCEINKAKEKSRDQGSQMQFVTTAV